MNSHERATFWCGLGDVCQLPFPISVAVYPRSLALVADVTYVYNSKSDTLILCVNLVTYCYIYCYIDI